MLALPVLSLLSACGGSSEPVTGPDPGAAKVAAGRLCTLYKKLGQECEWNGTVAKADGHEISLSATVASEVAVGGSYVRELDFDVMIDGVEHPQLRGRAVGGGTSREEAHEKAADDWGRVYATAIIDRVRHNGRLQMLQRLQDDQPAPPAFVSGGWVAYAGWSDLRGTRTERKPIDIQALLDTLQPEIAKWPTTADSTHAVHIQINHKQPIEKECTLDGQPSEAICDLALTYDWPKGSYLIKQYFVLTPGPLPGAVEARPILPEMQEPGAAEPTPPG